MTKGQYWGSVVVLILLTAIEMSGSAFAAPVVPGFDVQVYAQLQGPFDLSFGPSSTLFVGQFGATANVQQISPGGGTVQTIGDQPLPNPVGVLFDATGAYAGTPNSVLVAANPLDGTGEIDAIAPDGTTTNVVPASSSLSNIQHLEFDNAGRLLFRTFDGTNSTIWESVDGSVPAPLFSVPTTVNFAIDPSDPANRIFTSGVDGIIRIFSSSGSLLNGHFATNFGNIAFSNGGAFGSYLYALDGPNLLRIDQDGNSTTFGTGLPPTQIADMTFGPDGALYLSDYANNQVLRIAAVPEPSTLLLMLTACLALPLSLARRRASDRGASHQS